MYRNRDIYAIVLACFLSLPRSTGSGALLHRPPGTGKTPLAADTAREARAALLEISAAEMNSEWHGGSEKSVKAIFKLAQMLGNRVTFIDEADGLIPVRNSDEGRWCTTITNQFLGAWYGVSSKRNFVLMATNRPSDLDPAVSRRFQRQILVDLPKEIDRL